MKLNLREKGGAYVLLVSDKIDKTDVAELAMFFDGIAKRDLRDFILDLSELRHVVSSSIGIMLAQFDLYQRAGRRFVIVGPGESVAAAVLQRMGVYDAVPVFPTRDAALASFPPPAGPVGG